MENVSPAASSDPDFRQDREQGAPLVLFLSTMCLLDPTSGAAISVRNILKSLAGAGFTARSFTASLFDPNAEISFAPILGNAASRAEARGRIARIERDGVEHFTFMTASSRGQLMNKAEQRAMARQCRAALRQWRPDIVITYGTSGLSKHLQQLAREQGARIVFYFGNAEITDPDVQPGDRAICPSRYLKQLYEERFGIDCAVVHSIIDRARVVDPGAVSIAARPELRELGFVTFINPLPVKGLTLVTRLAQRALDERPAMKFLIVEGRVDREILRRLGVDLANYPNVWLLPSQKDMTALYRRTSILLIPSFWREGFGRTVIEAQLSGIPVLASDRGGLPEALAGGGRALDISDRCAENPAAFPDDETVDRWFAALTDIWDEEADYRRYCERAREAGETFAPERTRKAAIDYFSALAEQRVANRPRAANGETS